MHKDWISGLRSLKDGIGKEERTLCCEKAEETATSPLLSPNKRTLLNADLVTDDGGKDAGKRKMRIRSSMP